MASTLAGMITSFSLPLACLFWLLALRALFRAWTDFMFSRTEYHDQRLAEMTPDLPPRHSGRWATAFAAAAVPLTCLAAGVWQ